MSYLLWYTEKKGGSMKTKYDNLKFDIAPPEEVDTPAAPVEKPFNRKKRKADNKRAKNARRKNKIRRRGK